MIRDNERARSIEMFLRELDSKDGDAPGLLKMKKQCKKTRPSLLVRKERLL